MQTNSVLKGTLQLALHSAKKVPRCRKRRYLFSPHVK